MHVIIIAHSSLGLSYSEISEMTVKVHYIHENECLSNQYCGNRLQAIVLIKFNKLELSNN